MMIPLAPVIIGVLAWFGNKAIPGMWKHHVEQPTKVQIELAKDLCEKHDDCSVEKAWAMPKPTGDKP